MVPMGGNGKEMMEGISMEKGWEEGMRALLCYGREKRGGEEMEGDMKEEKGGGEEKRFAGLMSNCFLRP